jgi:CMP-N,N'-diacetyllegionaminic acid synthase
MVDKAITAIIPARAGSLRVPNKNKLPLNGHPLIAYSIITAKVSAKFEHIIVASDSNEICDIGKYYGADIVVKRNSEDATATSMDIDWLTNLYNSGAIRTEFFAILRPTSPLRSIKLMSDCINMFLLSNADSLRTVKKVTEHPGKMWKLLGNNQIISYTEQPLNEPASHAKQYQSLDEVYVQTSVLEISKTENIFTTKSREGNSILGYLTQGADTFSIDSLEDVEYLNFLVKKFPNLLNQIDVKSFYEVSY